MDNPVEDITNVINLIDLQNVLVVIDLASSRGAFRGPELQSVGQLFDKLDRFVKASTASTEPLPEQSGQTITTG